MSLEPRMAGERAAKKKKRVRFTLKDRGRIKHKALDAALERVFGTKKQIFIPFTKFN